jgi:hypothetical protein
MSLVTKVAARPPRRTTGPRLSIARHPHLAAAMSVFSGATRDEKTEVCSCGELWLGREDSNLRMGKSKSARTLSDINAYSEYGAESGPICINRWATEDRPCPREKWRRSPLLPGVEPRSPFSGPWPRAPQDLPATSDPASWQHRDDGLVVRQQARNPRALTAQSARNL